MAIYEPLLTTLNDAGVRYVVVGGLAVVLHGHARLTADVDLVIDLAPAQVSLALDTLLGIGLTPRLPVDAKDFANPAIRDMWIRDKGMRVFTMIDRSNPLRTVDLFVETYVPFEDLYDRSELIQLEDTSARVASIPDLIQFKKLADRPEDRSDIKYLEEILKMKEGKNLD